MQRKTRDSERFAQVLRDQQVRNSYLGVNLIPIVDGLLDRLGFAQIVDRYCRDEGEVSVSKIATAYLHSRLAAEPPPVYQFEEWVKGTILPVTLSVPPEKLNE